MKKIIYLSVVLAMIVISCKDYLDVVPEKLGTVEYAFRDRNSALSYLATCYSYMPSHESKAANPGRTVGNEITTYYRDRNNGVRITTEFNRVTDPYMNYWDGAGGVTDRFGLYRGIRDCNTFLENYERIADLSSTEKARWAAEVKFLKAYYHWWLIQLYGPIPLVRENLQAQSEFEDMHVFRQPVDTCINYVVQLIDEALPDLPEMIDADITEYGRITQPIAFAIKAKILVHAASPFFNGNAGYRGFKDGRGIELFNAAYDPSKWERAKVACLEAIELCEKLGYGLFSYLDPRYSSLITAETVPDRVRQALAVNGAFTRRYETGMNHEVIWGQVKNDVNAVQLDAIPAYNAGLRLANISSQTAPTLQAAENFYSANGVPIEEDIDWQANGWYAKRYETGFVDIADTCFVTNTFPTALLHQHREPRFYGSIAFDGSRWYSTIIGTEMANPAIVRAKAGEAAGRAGETKYSATGYFLRKVIHLASGGSNPTSSSASWAKYYWPIMRMADLYLLYAESLNETLSAPTQEVYNVLDNIRARSGLEGVVESWTSYSTKPEKVTTKAGMREIIQQERIIELAFEGHYFFDIRRWSGGTIKGRFDIMNELNRPIRGWNVDGTDLESFYKIRSIYSPQYSFRDYLWPIKESNLTVNKNLVQNPGW